MSFLCFDKNGGAGAGQGSVALSVSLSLCLSQAHGYVYCPLKRSTQEAELRDRNNIIETPRFDYAMDSESA